MTDFLYLGYTFAAKLQLKVLIWCKSKSIWHTHMRTYLKLCMFTLVHVCGDQRKLGVLVRASCIHEGTRPVWSRLGSECLSLLSHLVVPLFGIVWISSLGNHKMIRVVKKRQMVRPASTDL